MGNNRDEIRSTLEMNPTIFRHNKSINVFWWVSDPPYSPLTPNHPADFASTGWLGHTDISLIQT